MLTTYLLWNLLQGVLSRDEVIAKCNQDRKMMPIMRVRDNENNSWKRNSKTKTKTKKDIKQQGETKAKVKELELNGFVVHLG